MRESVRPVPYQGVDYWERVDNAQLNWRPFAYDHTGSTATLDESNTTVVYIRQDGFTSGQAVLVN